MKIRQGFVSNSSSSSFLMIGSGGVQTQLIIDNISNKELKDNGKLTNYDSDEYCDGNGKINFGYIEIIGPYFNETQKDKKKILTLIESEYAGKLIYEKDLENKSLKELKQEFFEELKKQLPNLPIGITDIHLLYGEYDY